VRRDDVAATFSLSAYFFCTYYPAKSHDITPQLPQENPLGLLYWFGDDFTITVDVTIRWI